MTAPTPPSLLSDAASVAVIRALLAVAREQGMVRRKFRLGRTVVERRWEIRHLTVFVRRGNHGGSQELVVLERSIWRLPAVPVSSAQQVADLLGAKGIELVPVELTSGWKAATAMVAGLLRRGLIESGVDTDRQVAAHMNRGDGAGVIFHSGARLALTVLRDVMATSATVTDETGADRG